MKVVSILDVKPIQLTNFNCGNDQLNLYLKRFSKKNDKLGIGKTYLLIERNQVLGYYTISTAQVSFHSLPEAIRASLPRYPIPVVRIGKLAVDKKNQRKGLGEHLLMNAFERLLRVAKEIAIFSVIVDAKDENAKIFYSKYGFTSFQDNDLSLFLPISTIREAECEPKESAVLLNLQAL